MPVWLRWSWDSGNQVYRRVLKNPKTRREDEEVEEAERGAARALSLTSLHHEVDEMFQPTSFQLES